MKKRMRYAPRGTNALVGMTMDVLTVIPSAGRSPKSSESKFYFPLRLRRCAISTLCFRTIDRYDDEKADEIRSTSYRKRYCGRYDETIPHLPMSFRPSEGRARGGISRTALKRGKGTRKGSIALEILRLHTYGVSLRMTAHAKSLRRERPSSL